MNTFSLQALAARAYHRLKVITSTRHYLALLLTLSLPGLASETSASANDFQVPPPVVAIETLHVDLLGLNDQVKALLDKKIKPIKNRYQRTEALHALMFSSDGLNISYSPDRTFTAQQTYDYRSGNCLSLASLFIASARYVGLDASFQVVNVPPDWENRGDFYVIPGHANALVKLPKDHVHVEFLRAFYEAEFMIDESTPISDKRALAEYHNNIAMELFTIGDFTTADKHLKRSVQLESRLDFVWSNFGVARKYQGDTSEAERFYRKATKLNRKNFSAWTNLYVLLKEQDRLEEAEKIEKKVMRHSRKNPYYMAKLAEADLKMGNNLEALQKSKKAIKLNGKEGKFYHLKARALQGLGEYEQALRALTEAQRLALDEGDAIRYQKKISALTTRLSR